MNSENLIDKYGWDGISHITAMIKLRERNPHSGMPLREEALQLEGETFDFSFGWFMGEDDPYPGEIAWIPPMRKKYGRPEDTWPDNAPSWIASGDLEILEEN